MKNKKIVLVAAPPACGKNYVSDKLLQSLSGVVYIDKDDLSGFVDLIFTLTGEEKNRDGEFFINNVRPCEYQTLNALALTAIRYSDTVILNAPFLKEVRDVRYMSELKKHVNAAGAQLVLIWITASRDVLYSRMVKRGAERDTWKLANFDEYISGIDFSAPTALIEAQAVDKLILFNNGEENEFSSCLQRTVSYLKGEK
jgi:predicted kinase